MRSLESAVLVGHVCQALEGCAERFHPNSGDRSPGQGYVLAKTPYVVDVAVPNRKVVFQVRHELEP